MITFIAGGASMPSENVVHLFPGRSAARWRRSLRAGCGLVGAVALALAPLSVAAEGARRLPPGHPPVGSEQLPPGHPPLPGGDGSCSAELPPGHPPVLDPRVPEGHPPVQILPCAPGGAARGAVRDARPLFFPDATVVET